MSFAVAAGNDGGLLGELTGAAAACNGSPSRVPDALTVGATDAKDNQASYSSCGTCLDLLAPGSSITSAWHTSPTAPTPSAALRWRRRAWRCGRAVPAPSPSATPATVSQHIVSTATTGVVQNPGTGSPNRLLFTAG